MALCWGNSTKAYGRSVVVIAHNWGRSFKGPPRKYIQLREAHRRQMTEYSKVSFLLTPSQRASKLQIGNKATVCHRSGSTQQIAFPNTTRNSGYVVLLPIWKEQPMTSIIGELVERNLAREAVGATVYGGLLTLYSSPSRLS